MVKYLIKSYNEDKVIVDTFVTENVPDHLTFNTSDINEFYLLYNLHLMNIINKSSNPSPDSVLKSMNTVNKLNKFIDKIKDMDYTIEKVKY